MKLKQKQKKTWAVAAAIFLLIAALTPAFSAQAEDSGNKLSVMDWDHWLTPWTGEGDCVSELSTWDDGKLYSLIAPEELNALTLRGQPVPDDAYTIEAKDGKTVLRLKEAYLKTLDDDIYRMEADFRSLILPMMLPIATTQRDGSGIIIEFPAYTGAFDALTGLYSDDGTRFAWNMLTSLRLGDRELTKDEYRIGSWNGTYITISRDFLNTLPYGEHRFTADFLNVKNVTLLLRIEDPRRTGDADGDGRVTAKDARLALRMAAQQTVSKDMGEPAADLDRSGAVEASEARQILRVAARIDTFRVEIERYVGSDPFTIDGLHAAATQYGWVAEAEPAEGLTVEERTLVRPSDAVGLAAQQIFFVTASEPGTYRLRLRQKTSLEDDCIDEIEFTFHFKELPPAE